MIINFLLNTYSLKNKKLFNFIVLSLGTIELDKYQRPTLLQGKAVPIRSIVGQLLWKQTPIDMPIINTDVYPVSSDDIISHQVYNN